MHIVHRQIIEARVCSPNNVRRPGRGSVNALTLNRPLQQAHIWILCLNWPFFRSVTIAIIITRISTVITTKCANIVLHCRYLNLKKKRLLCSQIRYNVKKQPSDIDYFTVYRFGGGLGSCKSDKIFGQYWTRAGSSFTAGIFISIMHHYALLLCIYHVLLLIAISLFPQ